MIRRKNRKYTLTAFGKIIYYTAIITIENATRNYWKLKAVDTLEMSNDLPTKERIKLIDGFISDQEIKLCLYQILANLSLPDLMLQN